MIDNFICIVGSTALFNTECQEAFKEVYLTSTSAKFNVLEVRIKKFANSNHK